MQLKQCIVGDHYGVYIPQVFTSVLDGNYKYNPDTDTYHHTTLPHVTITGVSPADVEVILSGPENDEYWDVWDTVLNDFELKDSSGRWSLWQDGDLFLVHEDWEEE